MSEQELPALMTRRETATHLRLSLRTVDRMIADGTLPAQKWRHSVRIPSAALTQYKKTGNQG